ncbi:MAG: hypothetical protein ACK564_13745, partial [Novosphingobium sp.]
MLIANSWFSSAEVTQERQARQQQLVRVVVANQSRLDAPVTRKCSARRKARSSCFNRGIAHADRGVMAADIV